MRRIHKLQEWHSGGPRDHVRYVVILPIEWVRELKWKGGQPIVLEWREGERHITIRELTPEEAKA
ncbi:MAG: hypothetical protein RXR82_08215 [Nitrososphaeria archaeon]